MILVHGGLDHARSWDWVARALRDDYHVYALDLRGHGNSAWAPGALYSVAEHVLDLSALADIINSFPLYIIGHSLGGIITLLYAGIYPDRVKKMVAIEGLGPPPSHRVHKPASERYRDWIESVRKLEHRTPHSYPTLADAVARMKEANPFLSDEVAEHLTLHGTNLERRRIDHLEVRQLCPDFRAVRNEHGRHEAGAGKVSLSNAAVLGPAKLGAGSRNRRTRFRDAESSPGESG